MIVKGSLCEYNGGGICKDEAVRYVRKTSGNRSPEFVCLWHRVCFFREYHGCSEDVPREEAEAIRLLEE